MKRRTFFKLASIAPFVRAPKGAAATPDHPTVIGGGLIAPDLANSLTVGNGAFHVSARYITVMIAGVPRKILVSE